MRPDNVAINRYAEAFAGVAQAGIGLDKALLDLLNLRDNVIEKNSEFMLFLKSPGISYDQKAGFIESVLRDGFAEESRNFLKFLVEKERIELLTGIIEYLRENYLYGNAVVARLKSKFPVSAQSLALIQERLERKFNRKVRLVPAIDTSLLGGVQVSVQNLVIDGSLRRRLNDLKEQLLAIRI